MAHVLKVLVHCGVAPLGGVRIITSWGKFFGYWVGAFRWGSMWVPVPYSLFCFKAMKGVVFLNGRLPSLLHVLVSSLKQEDPLVIEWSLQCACSLRKLVISGIFLQWQKPSPFHRWKGTRLCCWSLCLHRCFNFTIYRKLTVATLPECHRCCISNKHPWSKCSATNVKKASSGKRPRLCYLLKRRQNKERSERHQSHKEKTLRNQFFQKIIRGAFLWESHGVF